MVKSFDFVIAEKIKDCLIVGLICGHCRHEFSGDKFF